MAKQHKTSDRSVGNPKTSCIQTKSNKIWFRKTKSEKQRAKIEEKTQTELKKTQKDDVMEKYRKSSINDAIKNHE